MAKSSPFVDRVLERMAPLGPARAKPMFGGFGIFMDDTMFGLVTREEALHLRADDENRPAFEARGGTGHGKMPYYSIPDGLLDETDEFVGWAEGALAAAKRNAK